MISNLCVSAVFMALLLAPGAAYAADKKPKITDYDEPRESVSVALMPLDVEVRFVKVGGMDLRADWTELANSNFHTAITDHLQGTGETVIDYSVFEDKLSELEQLQLLQQHVAEAMTTHVVPVGVTPFMGNLPHKKNQNLLTYSLGPEIKHLRELTDADYAAFLTNRTVIESGGSFWTKALIGGVTGYTPAIYSFKGTYISLVDLKTGNVVWLAANTGSTLMGSDARNPENAKAVVTKMLDKGPFTDPEPSEGDAG